MALSLKNWYRQYDHNSESGWDVNRGMCVCVCECACMCVCVCVCVWRGVFELCEYGVGYLECMCVCVCV